MIFKWLPSAFLAILIMLLLACGDAKKEKNIVDLHAVAKQDVVSIRFLIDPVDTTQSINSEFPFTLQGLKSNGVDRVNVTHDVDWSLSSGAASSIDQSGVFSAAATAENITVTAKLGFLVVSIDMTVSAAKFDKVVELHESTITLNMCQSQLLKPIGRYVDDDGGEEIRFVDSTIMKEMQWTVLNPLDGSISKQAYIEKSVSNQTHLHTLAAGNIIIRANATSLVANADIAVDFNQTIDSGLNTIKLCLSSDADLSSCSLTSADVDLNEVLSLIAVGHYTQGDGSGVNENITRNSQWGIRDVTHASIAFSNDRQQLDVTGVAENTNTPVSVACGLIQQSLDGINITKGVTLDTEVTCDTNCVGSSGQINIKELGVLSFEVSANDIALTDNVSTRFSTRPAEITLTVKANLSNGGVSLITEDPDLSIIIIPVDGQADIIEVKADSTGVFTVLGAGTAKVSLGYRDESFLVVIEIP